MASHPNNIRWDKSEALHKNVYTGMPSGERAATRWDLTRHFLVVHPDAPRVQGYGPV